MLYDVTLQTDMYALAQQLLELQSADARGPQLTSAIPGGIGAKFLDGSPTKGAQGAWIAYTSGSTLVWLLNGASNVLQGAGLLESAALPRKAVGAASCNAWLSDLAVAMTRRLVAELPLDVDEVVVAGHSYGGCIGTIAAAWLVQVVPQLKVQVFTLGCPRPGDDTVSSVLAKTPLSRVMNVLDPIPRIPPHFDEAPFATFLVGYLGALAWSEYAQTRGGLLLHADHSLTPAVLPPDRGPIADANLVHWLGTLTGGQLTDHSVEVYVQRLAVSPTLSAMRQAPQISNEPAEVVIALPQEVFNLGPVAGPVAFQEIATMAGESVYIPPELKFKYQKLGRRFIVEFMGREVFQAETASKCRTMAKWWNKALRVVQNTQEVSANQLALSLSDYWQQASSPTSGVQPVLSVDYT